MGTFMQNGISKQKPSLATSTKQLQKISASLSSRQAVYAARDAASSVDPGTSLSGGSDIIEEESEEDEEEEHTEDPSLGGEAKTPAEKFAKKIIEKTRQVHSGVSDSMWRSFDG